MAPPNRLTTASTIRSSGRSVAMTSATRLGSRQTAAMRSTHAALAFEPACLPAQNRAATLCPVRVEACGVELHLGARAGQHEGQNGSGHGSIPFAVLGVCPAARSALIRYSSAPGSTSATVSESRASR